MGLIKSLTDTLPDSDSRSWSARSPLKGLCLCSSLDEKLGFDLLQFKLTASAKIGVVPEKVFFRWLWCFKAESMILKDLEWSQGIHVLHLLCGSIYSQLQTLEHVIHWCLECYWYPCKLQQSWAWQNLKGYWKTNTGKKNFWKSTDVRGSFLLTSTGHAAKVGSMAGAG